MLDPDAAVSSKDQRPNVPSRKGGQDYPDLIPCRSDASKASAGSHPLPATGSQSRQALLEAVKETLMRQKIPIKLTPRSSLQQTPSRAESEGSPSKSPRVGLYSFQHPPDDGDSQAKLGRLTVQQLPSVTIASARPAVAANRPQIIDVQSTSCSTATREDGGGEPDEGTYPSESVAEDRRALSIQPEEVARIVSDILAGELDLAFDAFDTIQRQEGRKEGPTISESAPTRRHETPSPVGSMDSSGRRGRGFSNPAAVSVALNNGRTFCYATQYIIPSLPSWLCFWGPSDASFPPQDMEEHRPARIGIDSCTQTPPASRKLVQVTPLRALSLVTRRPILIHCKSRFQGLVHCNGRIADGKQSRGSR